VPGWISSVMPCWVIRGLVRKGPMK